MTARERAFIAADLRIGKLQLIRPTAKQAAAIARVCVPYVAAAERVAYQQPHTRAAFELGIEPLIKRKNVVDRMASLWATMSEAQRIAFVKAVGPDATFDVAVAAA
jgi:hypothetical protein